LPRLSFHCSEGGWIATRTAKKEGRNDGCASNGHEHPFNLNELVLVKKLAEQLGGTARVKEVASALERLM
jgi:hypothetical protein